VRHPSVPAIAALTCAGLLGAGCGSSSNSSNAGGYATASSAATQSAPAAGASTTSGAAATGAAGGTVLVTVHTPLGTILAAGPKRLTVYVFAADKGSTSSCSGACAQAWPPVTTTGSPRAAGGVQSADLGTTTRSDGTKQVTYKGHPVYYYVSDQSSGETTGQGINSFGAAWYVLDPQGTEIE
jgi:predicted lipoprotein with Yx(FWY)xxD motif